MLKVYGAQSISSPSEVSLFMPIDFYEHCIDQGIANIGTAEWKEELDVQKEFYIIKSFSDLKNKIYKQKRSRLGLFDINYNSITKEIEISCDTQKNV